MVWEVFGESNKKMQVNRKTEFGKFLQKVPQNPKKEENRSVANPSVFVQEPEYQKQNQGKNTLQTTRPLAKPRVSLLWRWGESNPRPNGPSTGVYRLRSGWKVSIGIDSRSVLIQSRLKVSLWSTTINQRQAQGIYRVQGHGHDIRHLVRSGYD